MENVRRIDDLGRVVIPKPIRMAAGINEGDPLQIIVNDDGSITLRKYAPVPSQLSSEEYFFYEWLLLEKGMTTEKFKQLPGAKLKALEAEYRTFKKTLRG